jgi:hypothetical protein
MSHFIVSASVGAAIIALANPAAVSVVFQFILFSPLLWFTPY